MIDEEKDKCVFISANARLRNAHCLAICPCHVRGPRDIRCAALFDTRASTSFWKLCDIVQVLRSTSSRPAHSDTFDQTTHCEALPDSGHYVRPPFREGVSQCELPIALGI